MCAPYRFWTVLGGSILALTLEPPLPAQSSAAPTVVWEAEFRSGDLDEARAIRPARDGGFILLGWTVRFDTGDTETYAVRTDSRGGLVWQRVFEGVRDVMHVHETENGDLIIAAPLRVADRRLFSFLTLDSGGEEQARWTSIESLSADFFSTIRRTADGGYVLAGRSNNQAYLARFSGDGFLRWEREYPDGFLAEDVFENDDGSFILTGTSGFDAFVLRASETGQFLWNTPLIKVRGLAVRQTPDGGFMVAGLRVPARDETEVYLARLDGDGELIGDGSPVPGVQASQLLDDPDGEGYIMLGEATGPSGGYNFLLKVSSGGEAVWRTDFGPGATLYDLVAAPGGFAAAGRIFGAYIAKLEFSHPFLRGDANLDGLVDMSDAVEVLASLFLGAGALGCEDAADSNDDGTADMADAVASLVHLFLGTYEIPAPGPLDCGTDPTDDEIGCRAYSSCEG